MSIVAVMLKTESGDHYLYLEKDVKDSKDMVSRIMENMDTEFARVYDWDIQIIGTLQESKLSNLIGDRRDKLQLEIYGEA